MTNKMQKGFTLIELLVVVLIIGILAAVAVPQYNKAVAKSELANVWSTMGSLRKALAVAMLSPEQTVSGNITNRNPAYLDVGLTCNDTSVSHSRLENAQICSVACPSAKWSYCRYATGGSVTNPVIMFDGEFKMPGEAYSQTTELYLDNTGRSCQNPSGNGTAICTYLGVE